MIGGLQADERAIAVYGSHPPVVIIGAGPAGLTAAFEPTKMNIAVTVLEADSVIGGIARTVDYKGFLFDIGGHRFYTKVALVSRIWREVLGDRFLRRPRLSRIFFRGQFFRYHSIRGTPLQSWDRSRRCAVWRVR